MLRLAHQSRALHGAFVRAAVVGRAPTFTHVRLLSDSTPPPPSSDQSKPSFRKTRSEESTESASSSSSAPPASPATQAADQAPGVDPSLLPRSRRVEELQFEPKYTFDDKTQKALDTIEELGFKARQNLDANKYTDEELDARNWTGLEYHEMVSRLHNRQFKLGSEYSQNEHELRQLVVAGRMAGADAGVVRSAYYGKQSTIEKNEESDDMLDDNHVNEFMYDDIPTAGHMQVEKVRKIRHLQRMSAYVLPRLVDYHVPFDPVEADNQASPLTFKYTSYTGEPDAKEEAKVVCYFDPANLGMSDKALHKFKLLAGQNFDALTGQCKFASKRHPSAPENKHYLLSQILRLKAEAETGDQFEDVPLDTRFARNKAERIAKRDRARLARFPEQWNRPEDKAKQTAFKALFG